jgi:hypothetical protein
METPIRTENYKDYIIKVYLDDLSESPREWDNLGTMICFHNRYNLGDQNFFKSPQDLRKWVNRRDVISEALYLYDHSGITMSTTRDKWPFTCPWDSMQVGYIFVTKEKIREEFNRKRVTNKLIKTVKEILRSEVGIYDIYIRGDVIGYEIVKDDDDVIDSCWGYFNLEHLLEDAKHIIDARKGENNEKFIERE